MNSIVDISKEIKEKLLLLISTPGLEIEEVSEILNIKQEIMIKILTDEYYKHDLDKGRRLCCKF